MTQPSPHPRSPIDPDTGELTEGAPQTFAEALDRIGELEELATGHRHTIDKQARDIGRFERELKRYAQDEPGLPQNKEALALGERWRRGTGKTRAVIGASRIKLIRARQKDGYPMRLAEGAEPGPSLELAVDGLCAYPYEAYGRRYREDGSGRTRRDDLADALRDEKHVEALAKLGLRAHEQGLVTW